MISLYTNAAAQSVNSSLAAHNSRLGTSIERLSSGLRINSAADDAAGLAIRELQRADIAALHQGVRNASDAISLLQTADGTLAVIDEKPIRMKELAEQAATGTYDSTQRQMINEEFLAMGEEINRIARSTEFNGIKLIDGEKIATGAATTWFEEEERFVVTNPGSVGNLMFSAGHFGMPVLSGIDPLHYIDEANPTAIISVSLTATAGVRMAAGPLTMLSTDGRRTEYGLYGTGMKASCDVMGNTDGVRIDYDGGAYEWSIHDDYGLYAVMVDGDGSRLRGVLTNGPISVVEFTMTDEYGSVDLAHMDPKIRSLEIDTGRNTYGLMLNTVEINRNTQDYSASYDEDAQTVTVRLRNGGIAELKLDNPLAVGDIISFDIELEGEMQTVLVEKREDAEAASDAIRIHFGPMNDAAEDYYDLEKRDATLKGLGLDGVEIRTQDEAQEALVTLTDAMVKKDGIRAYYGTMQNRLENTISNLTIQAESLQAAESRISDADIAQEMMNFVRNQILAQSAIAMLAQANLMPQMAMKLIG